MTKAIPALALIFVGSVFAQAPAIIYDQTTHTCTLAECSNAQFDGTTATLSYTDTAEYMGQQNFGGSATWNGKTYTDFNGSINYKGHQYLFSTWELRATFNSGHGTIVETFSCYRGSCGAPHSNQAGEVVVAQ